MQQMTGWATAQIGESPLRPGQQKDSLYSQRLAAVQCEELPELINLQVQCLGQGDRDLNYRIDIIALPHS